MSNGSASNFSIVISMSPATVTALQQNGFQLYGFSGVDGPPGTVPVVWFSTSTYSAKTTIGWEEQYGGYTSLTTDIAPDTIITATFSAPMSLGQTMDVGIGGIGTVVNGGTLEALSILNETTTEFTCGITVVNQVTNTSNPICAFNLFGMGLDVFAPVEIVALMFATNPIDTGTVIEQSFAPGIVVNMTGQTAAAQLTFDINNGWTGPSFTTNIAANTNLIPFLINAGNMTGVSARAAYRMLKSAHAQ
jgi:hypothetical protein